MYIYIYIYIYIYHRKAFFFRAGRQKIERYKPKKMRETRVT